MSIKTALWRLGILVFALAGLSMSSAANAGDFTLVPSTLTGCSGCTSPVGNVFGMTFLGTSNIQNDLSGGASPTTLDAGDTFVEYGALNSTGLLSAESVPILPLTSGVNVNWQIGAIFDGLGGVNTSVSGGNANFTFTPGLGTISIYAAPLTVSNQFLPNDPSSIAAGQLVGVLSLLQGNGNFDFNAVTPDGRIDLLARFTSLPVAGFWENLGVPINLGSTVFLAVTDSNNNLITASSSTTNNFSTFFQTTSLNDVPSNFFTSNDGSVQFTVPEPGSLALLATGLLLIGFWYRRREES